MSRYDYDFKLENDDIAARVVRLVGYDKRVLELGCASGHMAKILRSRGCQVVGLELDAEAAAEARAFCVAVHEVNLDDSDWPTVLAQPAKFDVIIAADVLEHLRDPRACLARLRQLLEDDGILVISTPNIAHGGVIASLMQGNFEYRDTGLLDRTHIHFFTESSLRGALEQEGFLIGHFDSVDAGPDHPEFQAQWQQLTPEMRDHLQRLPNAMAFQFILSARKRSASSVADEILEIQRQLEISKRSVRQIQDSAAAHTEHQRQIHEDKLKFHADNMQFALRESLANFQRSREKYITQIKSLEQTNADQLALIQNVFTSSSWRITAPLRLIRRAIPVGVKRVILPALRLPKKAMRMLGNVQKLSGAAGGMRQVWRSLAHAYSYSGWRGGGLRMRRLLARSAPEYLYENWVEKYDTLTPEILRRMQAQVAGWQKPPLISVVMPTYNTDEKWLRNAIDSLLAQVFQNWELCIADDASTAPHVRTVLEEYMRRDARIKVRFRQKNGHISAASNDAIELARGDYIALLDHDDELPAHALYHVAACIIAHPEARMIYSDEDKIDATGQRCDAYFKPDWNPELFLGQNFFSHLGVYQAELVRQVGGFRVGLEGSQDYDLALRCLEVAGNKSIYHIPKILYHWRIIPGSTATSGSEKPYAFKAASRAVAEHLERTGQAATVEEAVPNSSLLRVRFALPVKLPRVSIIIPTRDAEALVRQCIDSIRKKTTYINYEIILIDNGSTDPGALGYFEELKAAGLVMLLRDDSPFNYSALNNKAASVASGEILCLLNNDIEVITPDWLEEMVSHAVRPEIGAVGARLWYPNNTLQHGGVVLGMGGIAGHVHHKLTRSAPGYFGRATLVQNFSAVTAACLVIRKCIFDKLGGLNESHLTVAFNDVDFCIRVRNAGYRNVWTPFAELYHHESATRGSDMTAEKQKRFSAEIDYMSLTYGESLYQDPAYNRNLNLRENSFSLAFPPRAPHS